MKKINSIGFGSTMLKWASILIMLVPALLFVFGRIANCTELILIPIYVSAGLGSLLLISLFVILSIELNQDKRINHYYLSNKDLRIKLQTGYFECQNCGYSKVKENDTYCLMCGMNFKNK